MRMKMRNNYSIMEKKKKAKAMTVMKVVLKLLMKIDFFTTRRDK
jgi:hypothetical protein